MKKLLITLSLVFALPLAVLASVVPTNTLLYYAPGYNLAGTSSPTVGYLTATSTTATSTFAGGLSAAGSFYVQGATGKVGAGTSTPMWPIDSYLSASNYGVMVERLNGARVGLYTDTTQGALGTQSNHPLSFFTNDGNPQMRLSTAGGLSLGSTYYSSDAGANNLIVQGNVGIGTTNPEKWLQVGDGSHGALISSYDGIAVDSKSASADIEVIDRDGNGAILGVGGGLASIGSRTSVPLRVQTNSNNYMGLSVAGGLSFGQSYNSIDPGLNNVIIEGNVGIGTTSPTKRLEITSGTSGSGYGSLTAYSDTYGAYIGSTAGSAASILGLIPPSGDVRIGDGTMANGQLSIYNGITRGVLVASNGTSYFNGGNVGIATTTPYKTLSVGGDVVVGASTAGGTLGDLYLPKTPSTLLASDSSGKVIGASSLTATTTIGAPVIIGNSSGHATSTITLGSTDTGNEKPGCINFVTYSGGVYATSSMYMIGSTVVGEANPCR